MKFWDRLTTLFFSRMYVAEFKFLDMQSISKEFTEGRVNVPARSAMEAKAKTEAEIRKNTGVRGTIFCQVRRAYHWEMEPHE